MGNSSTDFRLSLSTIFRGGGGGGDKPGELESGVSGVSGEKVSCLALVLTSGREATVDGPETSDKGEVGILSTAPLSTDKV